MLRALKQNSEQPQWEIETLAGIAIAQGRHGELSYFSGDDPIGRSIRTYGEWAQAEIDFLCSLIGYGSAVVDIGANIGTHAIALSKKVGPRGSVHAFEPQTAVFNLLRRNLSQNKCHNVDATQLAISDRAGDMIVPEVDYLGHVNIGAVALLPASSIGTNTQTRIQTAPIDDLHLERCDLVKIDAEGMGANVIRGMTDTIRRLQPLIYCECNTVRAGCDLYDLMPPGYSAYLVRCPAFNEHNVLASSDNIFGHACESSLLFVPAEAASLIEGADSLSVQIIPFVDADDLAGKVLATPRYGDATPFVRDPARLGVELRTLQDAMRQQQIRIEALEERNASMSTEAGSLHARLECAERALDCSEKKTSLVSAGLDARDEEITRLRFRCTTLSKQLTIGDNHLIRAQADREQTEAELTRVRQDFEVLLGEASLLRDRACRTEAELERIQEDLVAAEAKADQSAVALGSLRREVEDARSRADKSLAEATRIRAESTEAADQSSSELRQLREQLSRAEAVREPPNGRWSRGSFFFNKQKRVYRQISASGLFDPEWYLSQYDDVARSGMDPLVHYLQVGASEGRNPSSSFSTSHYCRANPDVVGARINPLLHYVLHGQREGRAQIPLVPQSAVGAGT